MTYQTPESLLDFWIGPAADDAAAARARNALWFRKSFATDAEIAERFLETLAALAGGMAYEWALASPRGRLAAIIALDQFPRNIFRDSPAAFELDGRALDLAMHGILLAEDMELKPIERQFFYMPLEHSERLSNQTLCIRAMTDAMTAAPPPFKPILKDALGFAEKHRDVIAKFGRFPHRNAILGRTNTAAEEDYLAEPGSGF